MSRIFYLHMQVKFTCINKLEAMYKRPCLNLKVERVSAFAFTSYRPSHLDTREGKGGKSL